MFSINLSYSDFIFLLFSCEKSMHLNEIYDADTVLDSMKVKMRQILSKHKDGILCNDFMNIYGVSIRLNKFLFLFTHMTYNKQQHQIKLP